ncbi:MAG: hypothetical protein GY699_22955 [Desulfobacteraceae bacterium]|nr:hypothetical protein [Desulfobacteraceae bacterium]
MQDQRLYNSVIIANYLSLLKQKYPGINADNVLGEAGIEKWELDPGHWFSQATMNKFQQVIVEKTGDPNIAREAGRFSSKKRAGNLMRQAGLTLLSPSKLYDIVGSIASKYTKACNINSKTISANKHEISVTYKNGVKPEKYQCLSFLGYLEAMYMVFHSKPPNIDHVECVFENGNACKYIISWHYTLSQILKSVRNVLFLACFIMLGLVIMFDWPVVYLFLSSNLILLSIVISVYYEKKELFKTVNNQDFKPHDVLDSHNRYYLSTNLISEVGSSLSRNTSVNEVMQCVANMFVGLGYQSGLILRFDYSKTNLLFKEAIYYKNSSIELIKDLKNKTASFSVLDPVFSKPIIDDINLVKNTFPEEITSVLDRYGSNPNIYIPIIFERSLLGFIFLNRNDSQLQASDLNLLNAIASQAALSITNVSFFDSLLESETLKRDFVTVASHEMLTPIQIINLAYQDIFDTLSESGQMDKNLLNSINTLEQALEKLNHISTTVLNFSELEGGLKLLPVETDDLLDIVKKGTEHIKSSFGHTIGFNIDKSINKISCHKNTFSKLIVNLIENSAKYTPENGHIEVSFRLYTNLLSIAVADNGLGVDEDFHDKIFMKFFQVDSTKSGCGLGLSFCQDVAKKHGGYISLDSPLYPDAKIRKGSRFIVHLPISMAL